MVILLHVSGTTTTHDLPKRSMDILESKHKSFATVIQPSCVQGHVVSAPYLIAETNQPDPVV